MLASSCVNLSIQPTFITPQAALNNLNLPTFLIRTGIKMMAIHIVLAVVALLTSVVLSRGLGALGYGIFTYAMTVLVLLRTISQMGIPALITREATRSKEQNLWAYFRAMLACASRIVITSSLLVTVISFAVLWLLLDRFSDHMLYTFIWLLLLLPVAAFMGIISTTLHGFHYIITNKIISEVMPAAVFLAVISVLFFLLPETHFPEYATFTRWLIGILVLLVAMFVLWQKTDKKFWLDTTVYSHKELLLTALPFTLITGSLLLRSQIDIFMLGFFRSGSEVGIYRVATNMSVFALLASQIIISFVGPQMVKMYSQNNIRQLQKLVTISTRIAFVFALSVCSALWGFGKELIDMIFGAEFVLAYIPLSILMIGKLFSAMMGPVGLLAKSSYNEKYVMRIAWFNIVLSATLNLFFIPLWGMAGAAISTVICAITSNSFLSYISRTKIGVNPSIFYV